MKKVFKVLTILFTSWFLIHTITITIDGLNDNPTSSDFAVILGNTVNEDGTLSPRLKARVDKGLELYRDSLVKKLFVSGGLGKEGHYEGSKMADYLMQHGVSDKDIVIDNSGNTTNQTAINFTALTSKESSVIVVSQFYHISRCKLAFKKVGVSNVSSAHANHFELKDVYSLFREFFGFYAYLLRS